jgi:hypothetical protein
MDIDAIEPPDPELLPHPEPIVHSGNYSTIYHPFHHLVDQLDPDPPDPDLLD